MLTISNNSFSLGLILALAAKSTLFSNELSCPATGNPNSVNLRRIPATSVEDLTSDDMKVSFEPSPDPKSLVAAASPLCSSGGAGDGDIWYIMSERAREGGLSVELIVYGRLLVARSGAFGGFW